jgi:hypothetical protein
MVEERSGLPSVVSSDLFQSVDQQICERLALHNFRTIFCEFPHTSHTVLLQVLCKMASGNGQRCAKTPRMASALSF